MCAKIEQVSVSSAICSAESMQARGVYARNNLQGFVTEINKSMFLGRCQIILVAAQTAKAIYL